MANVHDLIDNGIGCECATEQGNGVELNLVNVNQVVVKKYI